MDKRIRIGIVYLFNDSWLGGVYYIQNILKSLCLLDDSRIPFIDFYCINVETFEKVRKETAYPYLIYHQYKEKSLRKKIWIVLKKISNRFAHRIHLYNFHSADVLVYPYYYGTNVPCVFWCPDFQEKYLPDNFSVNDLRSRANLMKYVGDNNIPIVFSSETCLNDYRKFYPSFHNNAFVVKFAVIHPDYSDIDINTITNKYGIEGPYILCANQFWKHKNHLFLFKAYRKAVEQGLKIRLICTGNHSDYRNPEYIEEIDAFISERNNDEMIKMLGMIDRKELLCLMKNSYAVIQPSLFEGWNTTVEDCKSMNKFIFLSDLPVHREQIKTNVCFFDPHNEFDLVNKLLSVEPTKQFYNYQSDIMAFGRKFSEMIESMNNHAML